MRKYIKTFTFFIASMIILSSCIKNDFKEPEKTVYNPGITETTTINELKNLYTGQLTLLDTNVIIKGTVIANDKTGNYYKAIVLQDSTGGIEISLDAYELHNLYHIGDLVYVKCQGLYLGEYGEVVQLGAYYEGSVGRIAEPLIKEHLFKSDGGIPIKPKPVTFPLNLSYINQLVVLNDVQFSLNSLGLTYGDADLQEDRDIPVENCGGTSVNLRTGGYADFARDTIAHGHGSLIAVLTFYNGTAQLKLRDTKEISFNDARCGDVYYKSFKNDGIDDFTAYSVIGDQVWTHSTSYGAVMSGFASVSKANEDWLISPAINLSEYSDMVLRFRHAAGYFETGFENDLKVFICDNYDGVSNPNTSGTWHELTGITYSATMWGWVDSGDLDISMFNNNSHVYVAFKYTSSTSRECTWEIDNMRISLN